MSATEDRVHEYPKMRPISPQDQDKLARYSLRNAATRHALYWLAPNPNLDGTGSAVAEIVWEAAEGLAQLLNDGIELSAGLRKLREAKDCFVIQALEDGEDIVS